MCVHYEMRSKRDLLPLRQLWKEFEQKRKKINKLGFDEHPFEMHIRMTVVVMSFCTQMLLITQVYIRLTMQYILSSRVPGLQYSEIHLVAAPTKRVYMSKVK